MLKFLLKLLPAFIFILIFFSVEPAFAQSTGAPLDSQRVLAQLQQLIGVLLSMLSILIWPLLSMIGALMGNDLIFGPQVEDRLLLIWGQVRNFINLAFVLVLVGLAIYNVAGIGEESNYTLKKILPRFLIALIVVNFTFFGAKVILSSVNVLTTAVFALPNNVEGSLSSLNPSGIASKMCPTVAELYPENGFCIDQSTFTPQAEQFFSRFSGDNIAYVMALNYAQIGEILQVSELVRQVPTVQSVTINLLISLLMYFVYTIAFVVMFIVLVVRVVVLWFVIALSPILALQIVFPEGAKSLIGEFDIKDIFIKHAFAPAIIGMGLVIGHMLLDAYSQNTAPSLGSSLALGADFGNAFSVGSDGIQQILIGIAAAAVIWKVSFTAADGTVAKGITDSIKGWVERTAGSVAKIPTYLPIVPVPNSIGDGSGKAALAGFPALIENKLQGIRTNAQNSLMRPEDRNVRTGASLARYIQSNELDARNNEGVIRTIASDNNLQRQLTVGRFKNIIQEEIDRGRIGRTEGDAIIRALGNDENIRISELSNRDQIFQDLRAHQSIGSNGRGATTVAELEREDREANPRTSTAAATQSTGTPQQRATNLIATMSGLNQVNAANIETARTNLRSRIDAYESSLQPPAPEAATGATAAPAEAATTQTPQTGP